MEYSCNIHDGVWNSTSMFVAGVSSHHWTLLPLFQSMSVFFSASVSTSRCFLSVFMLASLTYQLACNTSATIRHFFLCRILLGVTPYCSATFFLNPVSLISFIYGCFSRDLGVAGTKMTVLKSLFLYQVSRLIRFSCVRSNRLYPLSLYEGFSPLASSSIRRLQVCNADRITSVPNFWS